MMSRETHRRDFTRRDTGMLEHDDDRRGRAGLPAGGPSAAVDVVAVGQADGRTVAGDVLGIVLDAQAVTIPAQISADGRQSHQSTLPRIHAISYAYRGQCVFGTPPKATGMAINRLLFQYKGNCCSFCGKTVEQMLKRFGVANKLFQFHHIDPDKKHPDYNKLMQRKLSTEQLDEVDKCVLLCSDCHIILEAQKGEAVITLTRDLGDRAVEQKITGNIIVDMEDRKIHFFSEDVILLDLYDVQRGKAAPEALTGIDLHENNTLSWMLLETLQTERLLIRRHEDQRQMLEATRLNRRSCRLHPSVEFSLIQFNGLRDDGTLHLSVRKGRIIINPKKGPAVERPVHPEDTYNVTIPYANLRKSLKEKKDGD